MFFLQFEVNDLPPMPRNRSHQLTVAGRRPMNIKTQLCREFEKDLTHRLLEFEKGFKTFKQIFIPSKNYVSLDVVVFTPGESLFTRENTISARSVDFDAHKVMVDTVFRSLDMDDKVVRKFSIFTPESHDGNWNYTFGLTIRNLDEIRKL